MSLDPAPSPGKSSLRFLEPLAASLWILFLVWSVIVALIWSFRIGEAEIMAWTTAHFHLPEVPAGGQKSPLQEALISLIPVFDQGWVILAAVNVYAFTAAREGLATARKWAFFTLLTVFVVAGFSATRAQPLGPILYTKLLGFKIAGVPYGLPLFWFAAIVGARGFMLQLSPSIPQYRLAFGAGAMALFLDVALEPVAWKLRVFWLWYPGRPPTPPWPPMQNYITWFVVGVALVALMRETRVLRADTRGLRSPAGVFMTLFAVLTVANLARVLHAPR